MKMNVYPVGAVLSVPSYSPAVSPKGKPAPASVNALTIGAGGEF